MRDISGDISQAKDARASRLLLKAIRSLSEREQDAVLGYLLDRALVSDRVAVPRAQGPAAKMPSIAPAFQGTRMEAWSSSPWARWGSSLILCRLGDGVTVDQLAAELGLEPEFLKVALRDLARRPHVSERLAGILRQLAEGNTIAQAARKLGITKKATAAELEPSDELADAVCASLMARAALPGPPAGYLATTAQGPLRTMPVRLRLRVRGRATELAETSASTGPLAASVQSLQAPDARLWRSRSLGSSRETPASS